MRQWCADRYERYPVTPEVMNSYHEQYIDGLRSHALTMVDGSEVLGYVTLRTPADDRMEKRLGFVIVDDSKRGSGLGKALVRMAVKYAFETLGATKVSLGVFENNPSAIRCYESVGFRRVATSMTESYVCMGETWNCIEMELNATSNHVGDNDETCIRDHLDGNALNVAKSGGTRSVVYWLYVTIAVMFILPFAVARLASEDSGMALCMILFLAVNPVYSIILGAACGKDVRRMWNLPLVSSVAFLAGTWLFFDIKEPWFLIYAAVYLTLGWGAMFIDKCRRKSVIR